MKAILVLKEMPNSCPQCPCIDVEENSYGDVIRAECGNQYKGDISEYLEWGKGRPSWCPLKPLPDCPDVPDTIANDVAYILGWNDCLVEISKERKEAKSLIKNEKESVSNANGTSIK